MKSACPVPIGCLVNPMGYRDTNFQTYFYRVPRGGGNWGTLRIPREDWGTLGKIREPPPLGTPPLNNPTIFDTNFQLISEFPGSPRPNKVAGL